MAIKRGFFGQIKSIDGQKVKRNWSGAVKQLGDKSVDRGVFSGEIKKVGGEKVKRNWSGQVKEAPEAFYKASYVESDDKRRASELDEIFRSDGDSLHRRR